jgi:hypothetical protein
MTISQSPELMNSGYLYFRPTHNRLLNAIVARPEIRLSSANRDHDGQ